MVSKILKKILLKYSIKAMRQKGIEILKSNNVTITCKKIGDIYVVYGKVDNIYDSYIKIDYKHQHILGGHCSCTLHKEYKGEKIFLCSHMCAAFIKFILYIENIEKSKQHDNKSIEDKVKKKSYLKERRMIKSSNEKTIDNLDNKNKIDKPKNDDNKIEIIDKKQPLKLNKKMALKIKRISGKGLRDVYEVNEYPYKSKQIVNDDEITKIFNDNKDRLIRFTYDYLEVPLVVKFTDLPLTFTMKIEEEMNNKYIVAVCQKNLPNILSSNNDSFFYNNEIYVPKKSQANGFMDIYDELSREREIKRDLSLSNYYDIYEMLSKITKDIYIREEVMDYLYSLGRIEFNLYVLDKNIMCDCMIFYGDKSVNIFDSKDKRYEVVRIKIESCNFLGNGESYRFIGNNDDLYDLLSYKDDRLRSLGNIKMSDEIKDMIVDTSFFEYMMDTDDSYEKMKFNLKDMDDIDIADLCSSFKAGNDYYYHNGKFIDFNNEKIRSKMSILSFVCGNKIENNQLLIDESNESYINELLKRSNFLSDSFKGERNSTQLYEACCIPDEFNGELKEYQVEGMSYLNHISDSMCGCILADEMGLGKTIQTIAFMVSQKGKKFLISCPSSLIFNWRDEINKFAPTLSVGICYGKDKHNVLLEKESYDVIITSYTTLKLNVEEFEKISFDTFIIDEAQNIKNYKSQVAIAVKKINSTSRIALTGTPIENNMTELWSIIDFILPGYLGSISEFKSRYSGNIELLRDIIKPFILRRTKQGVNLDISDKNIEIRRIKMNRNQKKFYDLYLDTIKKEAKSSGRIELLSFITKLREICIHPSLVDSEYEGRSSKIDECIKIVDKAKDRKILIFSQFTSSLDIVEEELSKNNIKTFRIDGKMSSKSRIKNVNSFKNHDGKAVFLISLKAGGTGLNLTSATIVIHLDPWWNPSTEDQATDRAHRMGQKKDVDVIKMIAEGSIEEKIIKLQDEKKKLIDEILSGDIEVNNNKSSLSDEEIRDLLN